MKKALLVDDDYLVRTYLKSLSSWERAGFEIVADVRDGEEALEVLKKEQVDLVLTDIAMPLMDGIELIHAIRENYGNISVIVLSCHDEFEFVKQAMKEGADEYVLKNSLDEESLYQQLLLSAESIDKKERSAPAAKPAPAEKPADNSKFLFFNQILTGTLSEQNREQERIRVGVEGKYVNSAVIVIKMEEHPDGGADPLVDMKKEQYSMEVLDRFQKKTQEIAAEIGIKKDIIYIGNGNFCCFVDLSDFHKDSVMYQKLTTMASACYKISREEPVDFKIGVSNICIGTGALLRAYQQARMMIRTSFYDRDGIVYYDPDKRTKQELPEKARLLLQQEKELKNRGEKGTFLAMAKEAVETFREELTDSEYVLQWVRKIEHPVADWAGASSWKISYLDDVWPVISAIADRLFAWGEEALPEKISKPVRLAAEFAMAHYREGIGLSDAAAAAGVNATYLSYLFRQEMETGFSNYLLHLRLGYAKQLLREGKHKMWQIAEMSGFNDYHYFSKVFKKTVGQSPVQYKKQEME